MDLEIKPLSNINDTCRACLLQKTQMLNIFQEIRSERLDIKLSNMSRLKIVCDKELPSQICNICIEKTNSAWAFIEQVKKVDGILKWFKNSKQDCNYTPMNYCKVEFNSVSDDDQNSIGFNNDTSNDAKAFKMPKPIKKNLPGSLPSSTLYKCIFCKNIYTNKSEYKKHLHECKHKKAQSKSNNVTHSLNLRSKIKGNQVLNYKRNKKKILKKVVKNTCSLCSQKFKDHSLFIEHMKTLHKISKPFICNFCGVSYIEKKSLEIHIVNKHRKLMIEGSKPFRENHDNSKNKSLKSNENHDNSKNKSLKSNRFVCQVCEKSFGFKQSLTIHVKLHQRSSGKHPCPECNLLCLDEFQLKRHTKVAHTGETHECPQCPKSFTHRSRLQRHLLCHKEVQERKFKCRFCTMKFNYRHHLKNHERLHTGIKPYLCNKCGKEFVQSYNLTLHLRQHDEDLPHSCNICKKRFAHSQQLGRHVKTHTGEKPFMCSICGKRYTDNKGMKKHLESHNDFPELTVNDFPIVQNDKSNIKIDDITKEKVSCKECPSIFNSVRALKTHMKIHFAKHKCNVCNRSFSLQSVLETHLATHSVVQRKHMCKECGAGYTRLEHLKNHMKRMHLKERPFRCELCSKTFYQNNELKIHMRRHNGVKPFQCDICDKAFVVSNALRTHQRTHTGERPHPCKQCNRTFATSSALNNHVNSHNPTENIKTLDLMINHNIPDHTTVDIDDPTKNIIINDNQSFIQSNRANFYLSNIESDDENNLDLIVPPNNMKTNNQISTLNVVQSADGKYVFQVSDNLGFSVNENVSQLVEPKVMYLNINGKTEGYDNVINIKEYPVMNQSSQGGNIDIAQNLRMVSNKGASTNSLCYPTNTTIVYTPTEEDEDAMHIVGTDDMPTL